MKNTTYSPEPTCAHCGGIHYGSPRGVCPFICDRCHKDIRRDADPLCECPPLVPRRVPSPATASYYAVEDVNDTRATKLYMVCYQIPGEQHILCDGMYKWAADWLIKKLNETGEYPKPDTAPKPPRDRMIR